jgi:hypothetical protein
MLVKVTMDLGDGSYEEAVEYVDFNIVGCYVGELSAYPEDIHPKVSAILNR